MTKRLRSPIKWFGGKGKMAAKIVPLLEAIPHRHYCEPFGGGASVLLGKYPAGGVETYNDLDAGLYEFFTVLSDPALFGDFYRRVRVLPYHRRFYNEARVGWQDEPDRVRRVVLWYIVARQSFGGRFGASWGSVVTKVTTSGAATASTWQSALAMLPAIHDRLQRVQIENADWRVVLDRYDTPETLFYLDPPYVAGTRSAGGYAHEMTDADHRDMVDVLLDLQGAAVVSGYASALYAPLEAAGWRRTDWQAACHAAGRTRASGLQGEGAALRVQARTESVWVSPRGQIQPALF